MTDKQFIVKESFNFDQLRGTSLFDGALMILDHYIAQATTKLIALFMMRISF